MADDLDPQAGFPAEIDLDRRLYVQAVERNMTILQSFDGGRRLLTLSEIAERSGIGRSAVQRIVYTLAHLGFLRRDDSTQQFGLSSQMLQICEGLFGSANAGPEILSALQVLASETGESAAWVGREADEIVILQSVRSRHYSHVSLPIGKRFGVVTAASGQVFLAYEDPKEAEAIFARTGGNARERLNIRDFAAYSQLLDLVKSRGYALTEKAEDLYSVSMSVGVIGADGRPVGAVNVSALQSRLPKAEAEARLLAPMRAAAARIGRALGL
ncbi:IclR family transcriptional regulator [Frigidibacter sp.]|uniref:IclR family transcriptional regulator n=1 Tax=Frigidibacter sp. TaxID=2586418 RepID=UPI002733BD93|nr:IclR family transcriptional regulator [Frigidibacter sp.]MDP3342171.1 IclR family transcriptional regulator [Frigidibacter sp.]